MAGLPMTCYLYARLERELVRSPTLQRMKKGAKKKVAKKTTAKKKPNAVDPSRLGKTSKLGVSQTWIQVFEGNAKAEKEKRKTDAQISEFMKSEFPDLQVSLFNQVEIARNKYNRGGFHPKDKKGNLVKAKIHSQSHSDDPGHLAGGRGQDDQGSHIADHGHAATHQKNFKSHKK